MASTLKAQLQELLPFLKDSNQQVRFAAIQALAGHSAEGSPARDIFFPPTGLASGVKPTSSGGVVADLKLLCRDSSEIAHEAFKILVNISDSAILAPHLSETSFLAFLVSYIASPSAVMADLACMVLANTTSFPTSALALSNLKIPLLALPSVPPTTTPYYAPLARCNSVLTINPYPSGSPVPTSALAVLVDAFVRSAAVSETGEGGERMVTRGDPARKADLHFLASVFTNVSGTNPGREFFHTPAPSVPLASTPPFEYPLSKLTAFTEHPSTVRRKGIAATIRNCAFHIEAHIVLLATDQESVRIVTSTGPSAPGINVLPAILLPLAGPEEYDIDDIELMPPELQLLPDDKKREPNPSIRLTHIESLLLFCTTRRGRELLRSRGVYAIIKALHLVEEEEEVAEQVVRLVNLLKRDEGAETEDDGAEYWVREKGGKEEDSDEDDIIEIA